MSSKPQAVPQFIASPATTQKLAELMIRVPAAIEAAREIKVTDDATEQRAIVARKILKDHEADAEQARTAEVAPHNAFVKEVNGAFKKITDAISTAIETLDRGLLSWRKEKQRRIEEENRKIAAEVERQRQEAEARAAEEAKAAGNFTPAETQQYAAAAVEEVMAPAPAAPPAKTTRTDFGAASYPQVLDFRVTDLAALAGALPDAIEVKRGVVLNHGRCQEKSGLAPSLPGVEFFKRDSVSGR